MEHYDVCVIGGGPAGYAAAMRAIDLNKKVLLVENDKIGGTGIYNGALSSKTLWEMAKRFSKRTGPGRRTLDTALAPSWDTVRRELMEAQLERKHLYTCHMRMLQQEEEPLFTHKRGTGRFTSSHTIRIDSGDDTELISAEQFILATGSQPRRLPEVPIDEEVIMTSNGIDHLTGVPESIVIVGAGVVGCEFATIFSNFNCKEVHLIDRADRILPFEDGDVSQHVTKMFKKNGVIVHHGSCLKTLERIGDQVQFSVEHADGSTTEHLVQKALISIGRSPNLDNLNIENAGLFKDEQTAQLKVEQCKTNMPHIYCVGDANGKNMLLNMGEQEGRHAVECYWGKTPCSIEYDNVSSIMFLDPEVAGVGMNETQCQAKLIAYRVARLDYSCIARAIAMRQIKGFIKLIVSDDEEMRVLGIRVVGEHASSAIQAVALMIQCNIPLAELAEMVHPHPSITEGVQECARMLLNKSTFKSAMLSDKMKCFGWKPGMEAPQKAA